MNSRYPKQGLNSRIWVRFGLLVFIAFLFVLLPRIFETRAARIPEPPAGILYFVTTVADHDDGVCNSDCTLREAINAANANPGDDDGIEFAVTGTVNLLTQLPDITGGVSIFGPGANLLTVRRNSTELLFRIFNVTASGAVAFSGITITNGHTFRREGAGINHTGTGTVNVNSCTISANTCDDCDGGGISNSTGTMNVTNSLISDNEAKGRLAGGISNGGLGFNGGLLIITNTTIKANKAFVGAGISNSGTVIFSNGTLIDNSADDDGGAVSNRGSGTVTLMGATLTGNRTQGGGGAINNRGTGTVNVNSCLINNNGNGNDYGGGIDNSSTGTVNVTNSTITANLTVRGIGGGGISNRDAGTVNITNSTVTNNVALSGSGGGLYNNALGTVNIKSSLIALNSADHGPDVFGGFSSAGFNLIGKIDDSVGFPAITDLTGTIATPLDPLLDPDGLQDNGGPTQTIALLCQSPAVDKGTRIGLNGPLTADQRGFLRTIDNPLLANASGGDGTDIGAFEAQACGEPSPTPTPTPNPSPTPTPTPTPTESCPHGQGYWKNNPLVWPLSTIILGNQTYSQTQLLAILNTPVGTGKNADASLILADQWIATQLNIANGADPTPIAAALVQANNLLSGCTVPCGVKASSALGQQMIAVAALLEQYNKGLLTPGCGP